MVKASYCGNSSVHRFESSFSQKINFCKKKFKYEHSAMALLKPETWVLGIYSITNFHFFSIKTNKIFTFYKAFFSFVEYYVMLVSLCTQSLGAGVMKFFLARRSPNCTFFLDGSGCSLSYLWRVVVRSSIFCSSWQSWQWEPLND
jgi:hypothetical protein